MNYSLTNCVPASVGHAHAFLIVSIVVWIAGCDGQPENGIGRMPVSQPLSNRVIAVSYPLQYLTQRIAGDSIVVEFPVPADADPQTWFPPRGVIGKMQTADMVVANGIGASYAKWLTAVSLAESKICNSASKGLSLSDYIAVKDIQVVHSHGPEGEHSHPTMISRTWLDPAMAKKQAHYIARKLAEVYPDRSSVFESNLEVLESELDQLTYLMNMIKTANAPLSVRTATPQLKFFTRAAGLKDRHMTWFDLPTLEQVKKDLDSNEGDDAPTQSHARLMLFAGVDPGPELSRLLESKELTPVTIDLLDHMPSHGDYLTSLAENVKRLQVAIEKVERLSKRESDGGDK